MNDIIAQWFCEYREKLFCYAYSKTKNMHEADDVVQETFLSVLRLNQTNMPRNIQAYLLTTVMHKIYDRHNSKKRYEDIDEHDVICDNQKDKELSELLDMAVKRMPDKYRKYIEMFYLVDKKPLDKDVAKKEGTFRQRITEKRQESLKELRNTLESMGVTHA